MNAHPCNIAAELQLVFCRLEPECKPAKSSEGVKRFTAVPPGSKPDLVMDAAVIYSHFQLASSKSKQTDKRSGKTVGWTLKPGVQP